MRSIGYTVFGKEPKNIDDCIDYYLRRQGNGDRPRISLELSTELLAGEMYILNLLMGKFSWEFTDGIKSTYDTQYGGIFIHESRERQRISLENANRRLAADLETLSRLGIEVQGKEKRFNSNEV